MNKLNNLIKVSIIIGMLLISGSISFYYVIFLPEQERMKAYNATQEEIAMKFQEAERQTHLEDCLQEADTKDERDDCYKHYPPVRHVRLRQ